MPENFSNLDLLSVGVAIAAIGILGTVIFLSNRKSATNQTFLAFAIITILWGSANYFSYNAPTALISLWLFRLTIFFGVWHAFTLFLFLRAFPDSEMTLSRSQRFILLPLAGITALITFTPYVFNYIEEIGADGKIAKIQNGPGMALFGIVVLGLVITSIVTLTKKIRRSPTAEKRPFKVIAVGISLTFLCLMAFNFILPAFFDNPRYIPLGAIFIFPFIAFTTYAIIKHHLLRIKVVATEILTFVLVTASLIEIVFAKTIVETILRIGVFSLILGIGIMLILSVRREIEQRERLERLTKDLEAANEKLKELDKQKDQFLSFASHDLKSPINIIKQFATLIADGTYKEPAKVAETIQKIKTTADRATHLVDDFLDIRKIEEGHMDYAFETKDIVPFVRGVVEDYAPLAKAQKNIAVSFETKIASVNVKIDTTRFRQVIQNLLSNSLKYTESGSIKVKIAEEQRSVLISVQDSGIGMDTALLPVLFEQFRRDPGVAKKIQGTGLGLYISKQIVLGHGGEIWAASEGKGHGSTFYVRMKKI